MIRRETLLAMLMLTFRSAVVTRLLWQEDRKRRSANFLIL